MRDIRIFHYCDSDKVEVKYSMSSLESPREFAIEKHGVKITLPTKPMYNKRIPIQPAKLKDLKKLSDQYIPKQYQEFYNNITAVAQDDN